MQGERRTIWAGAHLRKGPTDPQQQPSTDMDGARVTKGKGMGKEDPKPVAGGKASWRERCLHCGLKAGTGMWVRAAALLKLQGAYGSCSNTGLDSGVWDAAGGCAFNKFPGDTQG